jgi:uncharacterized protein (DUF2062 family)
MSIADLRRKLHALEARLPPRVREALARQGHPLLALNRRAVARGAALGVFLGFVLPVGQIIVAVLLAPLFRANALASAAGTLVTNPLTLPPIWAGAYVVGGWVLAALQGIGFGMPMLTIPGLDAVPAWLPKIATGMALFATGAALATYHGVALWWVRATQRRWRRRREAVAA